MNAHFWWFLSRAAGMTSFALAALSIFTGLFVTTRLVSPRFKLPWLNDLHRYLSGLTLAFLALHIVSLAFDGYAPFSIKAMLLPFASSWRPGAVALGILALYCLIAIQITSIYRSKISKRLWRIVHASAIVVYIAALIHAIQAGPDVSYPAYAAFMAVISVGIFVLFISRLFGVKKTTKPKPARPGAPPQSTTPDRMPNTDAKVGQFSVNQHINLHGERPSTDQFPTSN